MGEGRIVRAVVLALAIVCMTFAVGCGGDDGAEQPSGERRRAPTLKVGVLPIGDLAPLYLGMDQGFFKEENLTIEPAVAEGGAAVVPAVMSGDYQIGFSNVDLVSWPAAQNLPLKPIAAGVSAAPTEEEAWDALLAPKGGVTDLKQLEGKKVSVNTLKNLPRSRPQQRSRRPASTSRRCSSSRSRSRTCRAALEAKRVDAAFAVEPFVGASLAAGATKLAEPFEELAPEPHDRRVLHDREVRAENADVVERFTRAMNKSLDFASRTRTRSAPSSRPTPRRRRRPPTRWRSRPGARRQRRR